MNKEVGFAIIGGGVIGEIHAQVINQMEGARLVAIAGRSPDKSGKLAEKYKATWYADYLQMLKREDIDIVNICTPSGMHCQMAVDAARAGKNILVEKPMEISLQKVDRMIAEANNFGVKLSVISQHRFDPATIRLKQTLQSGKLGNIVLAEAAVNWYRTQDYYDSANWRGTRELDGGGALINQSIHTIDLLLHFLGPVKSVMAHMSTAGHERIEVEDVLVAIVRFENGALCTIACTTAAYPGFSNRIELFGTEGSAVIEADQLVACCLKEEGKSESTVKKEILLNISEVTDASLPSAISGKAHYEQFADMIRAVKDNREPQINGEEGRKTLQLVMAMYQSARKGRLISF